MTTQPSKTTKAETELASPKINGLTHIIGIGASAGGLDPLERFFDHMPVPSTMAFVVIQHLSPDFKSLMDELLARHTGMPIHRVTDGMEVEAGNIYLIPPKKDMVIQNGRLRLTDKDQAQPLNLPIDTFFKSLAQDVGDRAVAIVLSGTGSDGSHSLLDFHNAGGLIIVQSPESSGFDGMPRSAIETGFVDIITEPELMPEVLLDHQEHSLKGADITRMMKYETGPTGKFAEIFKLLKNKYKIDFGYYKPTTVDRRIERRMNILRFDSIEAYGKRLTQDDEELNALYKDLLIGVTKFFRDPKAYDILSDKVIPEVIKRAHTENQDEIRVWVCGCATGEEAYSLAILFNEVASKMDSHIKIKIFASDVHRASLDMASDGVYEEEELENLSKDLRDKYFHRESGQYKTSNLIRQMIVFSEQNVLTDPPFIKIDLVSCRNLLIYFQTIAQRKALAMFHFALKHKGYLFLGASENLGSIEDEFDPIDRTLNIYQKKRDVHLPADMRFTVGYSSKINGLPSTPPLQNIPSDVKLIRAYDTLLERFMPPGLLISDNRSLMHTFGDAGRFFKTISGRLSSDVLNLVDGDLRIALTSALQRSTKDNVSVKYKAIQVNTAIGLERINLEVEPLQVRGGVQNYFLILFNPTQQNAALSLDDEVSESSTESFNVSEISKDRISYLEQELIYTKEHLQTTVEELETSNEELQATNEELLASNEELQSTNEELHSVNEELYTVNAEYERKNNELEQLADDMENLLRSTELGTVFVDSHMRIRKFTPAIAGLFNLLPQDIGRPIEHIAFNTLGTNTMLVDIKHVISSGELVEKELQNLEGVWMLQRILPYRNSTNVIEGAVLTFIDIDRVKKAEEKLRLINQDLEQAIQERAQLLVESDRLKSLVIDATGVAVRDWKIEEDVTVWSGKMHETFGYPNGLIENSKSWWSNKIGPNDWERVTESLDYHINNETKIWREEYHFYKADGSLAYVIDWGMPVKDENGKTVRMVGAMLDITEFKDVQKALQRLLRKQQTLVRTIGQITYEYEVKKGVINWTGVEILGFEPDEFGQSLSFRQSLIHPDDMPIFKKELEEVMNGKNTLDIECRYRHLNGHYTWFHDRGIAYFDNKGNLETIIGVLEDVSKQRDYQEQLEVDYKKLQVSNKDLEYFAVTASNDLKEPLNTILTHTKNLSKEYKNKLDEGAQKYINSIDDSANRVNSMIEALMDYSKVSAAKISRKKVSVCNAIQGALKNLNGLIEQRGAEVEISEMPAIPIDKHHMIRVFQNLIENAIKFNSMKVPHVHISSQKEDRNYVFKVSDNGVGIDPARQQDIFNLFTKLEDGEAFSGSGVGLAICERIIELHGGKIWVKSEPGKGSEFYFMLPAK